MKILSVELDTDTVKNLEDKSLLAGKTPENVLADVVLRYIHYSGWQQNLLELSIEGAERGDFATPEEIASVFLRWNVDTNEASSLATWSGLGLRAFRKELEHMGKSQPELSAELAKHAWQEATSQDLEKRAFPGMTPGTLEVQLADSDYCLAFSNQGEERLIIGIVSSM